MKPGELFLGRYRVLRALGEGPASEVVEAEDQRLKHRVAIKRLRPDLAGDPVWVTRFTREANVPILVGGEHVVKVHDDGVHDGAPFVVMEMLDGVPLDRLVPSAGRLPVGVVMEIGARVAAALDAAHQRGLVHRNVKSANVFIARTAKGPEVKLLGFASEKAFADARADVAALGAVLYAALSAQEPFEAGGVPPVGAGAPRVAIAELVQDLPEPVADLISRSLAPSPRDRFQSARGFASAIEPLRDAAAFVAYPFFKSVADARESVAETTGVYVTPRSNRRELVIALVVGLIGVLLVVVLVAISASNTGPATPSGGP